jgi:hypothetical protein
VTYDKTGFWKLYNLGNDLGENTNVADLHPDILQTMKAVYHKFAQDVGVVIPTLGPFSTLFPQITASNTQTINLTKMFVRDTGKVVLTLNLWLIPSRRSYHIRAIELVINPL